MLIANLLLTVYEIITPISTGIICEIYPLSSNTIIATDNVLVTLDAIEAAPTIAYIDSNFEQLSFT